MQFIDITGSKILCALSFPIIIANILEIILLLKTRKRWRNGQILLFNLAIADTILGLSTAIRMGIFLSYSYHESPLLLALETVLFYGNVFGSSFIVILISIDRWIAVRWPLKYQILMKKKRVYVGIILSWSVGALTVFGVVALNSINANNDGWKYIAGVLLIMETLVLLYLYSSIFFQYRKCVKALKASNEKINLSKHESYPSKNHGTTQNYPKLEADDVTLRTSMDSCGLKYTKSKSTVILENKTRSTQMSDKERRLLKFCVAIVICFLLSCLLGLCYLLSCHRLQGKFSNG